MQRLLIITTIAALVQAAAFGQTRLNNSIIGWETKRGLTAGAFLDEAAIDLSLNYVHLGLRTGWTAGVNLPARTEIDRSGGLNGAFFLFPNAFHSIMDPFLMVRGHVNLEEGRYTPDRPANALLSGRPLALLLRGQVGYGLNVNFGRYVYLQHMLGVGGGLEFYGGDRPLTRVSMMLSLAAGFHLFNYIRDRRR